MDELVIKARNGDHESFCRLMDCNLQIMYKIAWTYLKNDEDISDAISETICACFEKLSQLRNPEHFRTWLIRILINKCKDILSSRNRLVFVDELPEEEAAGSPYSQVEWKVILGQLADEYRTILLLYYLEDLPVREIAALLDLKENTVKSRLMRGRKQLLQILEGSK